MKNLLCLMVACLSCLSVAMAQMPAAISVSPDNPTSADLITLTFDPELACSESGTLVGANQVYMHSGYISSTGYTWVGVVAYNAIGANGQEPVLLPNPDGTYSITFCPDLFYYGTNATHICAVFNGGDWSLDGRDYDPLGGCKDFIIPLNGSISDTTIYFLVNLNYQIDMGSFDPENDVAYLVIYGLGEYVLNPGVDHYVGIYDRYVSGIETGIYHYNFKINGTMETIPERSVYIHSGINNIYHWYNNESEIPEGISIVPENATAWDTLTLTLDPELVCFESASLVGAPRVDMHSGVADVGGSLWSHIVAWNALGFNGQEPFLQPDGNGKYSITYVPGEFYGLPPGNEITTLCAVFNYDDWLQDGRDFTYDGAQCMDFFIPMSQLITHMDESDDHISSVEISPNPAITEINITSSELIQGVQLVNIHGNVVLNRIIELQDNVNISIAGLPDGVYFCVIKTTKGSQTKKIIKL
ncbi:MAG: T9SS type A sorting domain-containing protein [Bacteroidales bacterium]|nr:T9SS type A sorting domain-containing protein [Bacteroidales bacterium]